MLLCKYQWGCRWRSQCPTTPVYIWMKGTSRKWTQWSVGSVERGRKAGAARRASLTYWQLQSLYNAKYRVHNAATQKGESLAWG